MLLSAAAAVDVGLAGWDKKFFCENGVYHALRGGRISDHATSWSNMGAMGGSSLGSSMMART